MKCEYYQCDQEAKNICVIVNRVIYEDCNCESFEELSEMTTMSLLLCEYHTSMKNKGIFSTPLTDSMKEEIEDAIADKNSFIETE